MMVGMATNQKTLLVTDARIAGGAWRRCLAGVRVWGGLLDGTVSGVWVTGVRVVGNKHIVATPLSVQL